jgi:hypothetical protein
MQKNETIIRYPFMKLPIALCIVACTYMDIHCTCYESSTPQQQQLVRAHENHHVPFILQLGTSMHVALGVILISIQFLIISIVFSSRVV